MKKILLVLMVVILGLANSSFATDNPLTHQEFNYSIEQKQVKPIDLYKITEKDKTVIQRKGVDRYSDLSNKYIVLSVDQMNDIINQWEQRIKYKTPFHGEGKAFIDAANESGLDPLYIFAHAVIESGWGKSNYAQERGNYFGINAVDHDPDQAYIMGDSLEDGIVNGAVWIKRHYYNEGACSLYSMIHGDKRYASDPNWMEMIEYVWNQSYAMHNNQN